MTSPLNCLTKLPYSPSWSHTITSSSVTKIALEISFALKDFPLPGVPSISPLDSLVSFYLP